ncbi:hypothetical protein T459_04149 [Capsicum annuum]|uniref:HhH-GPD domain-containing protein n=1 Tax=Capsicum annuum TaxID=4072 RepID=A0A2G3A471_CAPAN|nr:hypothetical protein T459_04149 [Capsicum annuum]
MDDRSLFTMLSMVKGIGSWSVHMFMIFSLHRPDVLPVSDLGVRKGVQMLHGLEELPRPAQMEQLCDKWKPYRSAGAWYMWRLVEGKGTPTTTAAPIEGDNVHTLQQIQTQQEAQQHQLQLLEPINGIENLGLAVEGVPEKPRCMQVLGRHTSILIFASFNILLSGLAFGANDSSVQILIKLFSKAGWRRIQTEKRLPKILCTKIL